MQRPESVVKELVENSIDAGADSIAVIVRDAGKSLIHIVDNGWGMTPEDLKISVKRHATSKIFKQEDLDAIRSFGFRGEALASISSVAKIEIRTKTEESGELGWKLTAEPGREIEIEPAALDKGTQIFVRSLFYNVPARRKFLRANLTEFRHISNTMLRFALAHPDISFTFYDEDNLVFDLKPESLESRIKKLFSEETSKSLIPVRYSDEKIEISGYIGEPHLARKTKANQYFFLNKRAITSRSLSHAVFTAMENFLDRASHPFYLINFKLNPSTVDVNIHPQKHEVKFEDERYIYNLLLRTAADALSRENLVPEFAEESSEDFLVDKNTGEMIKPVNIQKETKSNFTSRLENEDFSANKKEYLPQNDFFVNRGMKQNERFGQEEMSAFEEIFGKEEQKPEQIFSSDESDVFVFPFRLFDKYLLASKKDELIIVDIKTARQKIVYEEVLKELQKTNNSPQKLLFPVQYEMNTEEKVRFEEISGDLMEIGYEFEYREKNQIELSAVPSFVQSGTELSSFLELLNNFDPNADKETKRCKTAEIIAVTVSKFPAGRLSKEDIPRLYQKLTAANNPSFSFDGKKTYTVLKEKNIRELLQT